MAILVVEKGKQAGERFAIIRDAAGCVIGRDSSADINLDDERASRRHARIHLQRGRFQVEDLDSRNGILHRGEEARRFFLEDGEQFQIGSTVLRLEAAATLDPLSGKESGGLRIEELLREEAGVLSYRARQLAMDRTVRFDLTHPKRALDLERELPPPASSEGAGGGGKLTLGGALERAFREAAALQAPGLEPLAQGEVLAKRSAARAVLRWQAGSSLGVALPAILELSLERRIEFFRLLAAALISRGTAFAATPLGPEHLRVDERGQPLVPALDLSALIAFAAGQAVHLPSLHRWIAPETSEEGCLPGAAARAYNLGALGYHLAAKRPPERGEGGEVLEPIESAVPGFPAELAALIGKLLSKDPAARPTARDEILKAIPVGAPPQPVNLSPPPPRPNRPVKKPAPKLKKRLIPLPLQFLLWPAIWVGLFYVGRIGIRALLQRL